MKSLKIHPRTLSRPTCQSGHLPRQFFANLRQHNHGTAILLSTTNTSSALLKRPFLLGRTQVCDLLSVLALLRRKEASALEGSRRIKGHISTERDGEGETRQTGPAPLPRPLGGLMSTFNNKPAS
ncbi:uncharacterized protein LOC125030777 isoform X2 [Penaeus chinensis]|uniref:uncharacterized protein LOC125030777 isoform X2 n=1 Tax=Penaeus chinensis TaxID=139456 RepID=UPI001FB76A0C|nr:uncharacterized protein LOC125030777 isoform X2 [Penaeus chinensis]